jgi:outer membrane receptor protein involved in Fe transport
MGVRTTGVDQVNNTFHWTDNVSKVVGVHTIRAGGDFGTPFSLRNRYAAAFAQDSWRMRSNLTVNYGLRWDRMEPWYDKWVG